MTEAPRPEIGEVERRLGEVRAQLAAVTEQLVDVERRARRGRRRRRRPADRSASREHAGQEAFIAEQEAFIAEQAAFIAEQAAVLSAAAERIGSLESDRVEDRAALVELARQHHETRSELQALYDSETWRMGRLLWHAGRRSGLSAVAHGPGRHLLDRVFGTPEEAAVPSTTPPEDSGSVGSDSAGRTDGSNADVVHGPALLRPPYRRARHSTWQFPGDRRWRGGLRRLADQLSEGHVPPDHLLVTALEEFRLDESETLITNHIGGRARDALHELRFALVGRSSGPATAGLAVIDARCLTDPDLHDRGIGRHATNVLNDIDPQLTDYEHVVALVEDGWHGTLDAVPRAHTMTVGEFARTRQGPSLFVSLSPATHTVVPECLRPGTRAVALAYDLIPLSFPRHYHASAEDLVAYVARLAWLRHFDEVWCISEATAHVHRHALALSTTALRFTGVRVRRELPVKSHEPAADDRVRILLCGGADPRKNLLTPLIGLRSMPFAVQVVVLGALPDGMAAELVDVVADLGDATTLELLGQVDEARVATAFDAASIVLVPSHAEGFSLPVAEAIEAGAVVVASDIDVHRELLGDGPWLIAPSDAGAWSRGVVDAVDHLDDWRSAQAAAYAASIGRRWDVGTADLTTAARSAPALVGVRRPTLAIVTPLPPQHTGIADYSAHTLTPLTRHFDVSWVVNDLSEVGDDLGPVQADTITTHLVGDVDHVLHVIGNSHFHLPALEHLQRFGGPVIAHDNRMTGVYVLWRREQRAPPV